MRYSQALVAALAAVAFAPAALAQEPAPPTPATLVEEVEIIAHLPGPALWRVSTPTSQIWLLALASPLPKGFQWDDRRVAKALDGARVLVIPPRDMGSGWKMFTLPPCARVKNCPMVSYISPVATRMGHCAATALAGCSRSRVVGSSHQ